MSDDIGPALTPAQWETVQGLEQDVASVDAITFLEIVLSPAPDPQAAAAALLYDRTGGFSREDADLVREEGDRLAAEYLRRTATEDERERTGDPRGVRNEDEDGLGEMWERAQRFRSLADRLDALLPPRNGGR